MSGSGANDQVSNFLHNPTVVGVDSSSERGDFVKLDSSREAVSRVTVHGVIKSACAVAKGPMVVRVQLPH